MSRNVRVTGMGGSGSEEDVKAALQDIPGVTEVEINRATGMAIVEGRAEPGALVEAIEAAGYEAELQ